MEDLVTGVGFDLLRGRGMGVYVNFLAEEGEERLRATYPATTGDLLRAVKRRHDPENPFRRNQNIPPAIGASR